MSPFRLYRWLALTAVLAVGLSSAQAQAPTQGAAEVIMLTGTLTLKGFRQDSRVLRLHDADLPIEGNASHVGTARNGE